ncbi:MAG: methyltransferase domain-containing protein [Rhodospirillales bacterium]|nr:methyltransferase domain-containing protein [Rhodospirillales bacterium]
MTAVGAAEITRDTLLGGRVRLAQPKRGLRAAIDPVLLAAAVPARAGEQAFEAGSGTGAAALCLAWRVPGVRVSGIELDPALVRLADDNARANGMDDRVRFFAGDLFALPSELAGKKFNHVFANPPFLEAGSGTLSPDPARRRATAEGAGGLAAWVAACCDRLAPGGTLTLIHRADRLDALVAALSEHAGGIVIFPLWAGEGKPAKRIIVAAREGAAEPTVTRPGLVLHRRGGGYTSEAEAILREGRALPMS